MKHITTLLILASVLSAQVLHAADDGVTTLAAPDGTTVVIYRDHYGVPHIRASTETGLFFGQGYAAAQDRLFQMETFRRTALGRLSEVGLGVPATDIQLRATFYTASERSEQFDRLAPEVRNMISSYASGINAFLLHMAQDPTALRPVQFFAPQLNFTPQDPKPWTKSDVIAVSQLFMRRFGQFGGEELARLVELNTNGPDWFDENRPINDPDAPTTIPGSDPSKFSQASISRQHSKLPRNVRPEVVEEMHRRNASFEANLAEIQIPPKLGSFAAIISQEKSSSGNVMLLGAPQLMTPALTQTNFTHEVELDAPSLHVAGMAIGGIPGVIIGHTENHAWTLTSGNSDNTDTFVELLNESRSAYLHNGTFHDFEVIPEPDLNFARLRTIHGPVVMLDAVGGQAFSWQFTFWERELEMVEAFYRIWKANGLQEFEDALRAVPMNFNVLYAGNDQNIKFYHVGTLLRNTQTLSDHDPRLPRIGIGTEEWGDDPFLSFDLLPQATQSVQSYFVNWNNKPEPAWNNGDNIAWSIVFRPERTTRVQKIEDFIGPVSEATFENLKSVPFEIADHGTYQQVVEFTPSFIRNENIIPPGQSGFISPTTGPSPHVADQWALHEGWHFKNMVFNEPVRLWPPNHKTAEVIVAEHVDTGDPATAFFETIWSDEGPIGEHGPPIMLEGCRTVHLRAERDAEGNGRVYTLHAAAPDPLGATGTAALFQVFVPKSNSSNHAFAVDDGPVLSEETGCASDPAPDALIGESSAVLLEQNRPNPFNPSTQIGYELPEAGPVALSVYNVLGQEMVRLVDGVQGAGSYNVAFDATGLSSGVYFYSLRTSAQTLTKMMILQK